MNTKQIVITNAIYFVTATSATYVGARYLTNVNPKIAVVAAATISTVRMFTFPLMKKHGQLTAGDIFKRRVPAIALALFSAAIVSTALFRVSIKISLLISTGVIFFTSIPIYIGGLVNIGKCIQLLEEKKLKIVKSSIADFPENGNPSELNKLYDAKQQIENRIKHCKIINKSTFSPLHYVLPPC